MKITDKLLCVAGAAIIISTVTGFAASEEKYFLHHSKAKKQEITEAMFNSYLKDTRRDRVRIEDTFSLQAALLAGALSFGVGLMVVGSGQVLLPSRRKDTNNRREAAAAGDAIKENQDNYIAIPSLGVAEANDKPTPAQIQSLRAFLKLVEEAKERTRQQQGK